MVKPNFSNVRIVSQLIHLFFEIWKILIKKLFLNLKIFTVSPRENHYR